jgi:hypothetical protein
MVKFKLWVGVGLLTAIAGVVYVSIVLVENKDDSSTQNQDELELIELQQNLIKKQNDVVQKAGDVTSVEDLDRLPEEYQSEVGIEKIKQSIEVNDLAKAKEFIDALMKEGGNTGVEAAILCYQTSNSDGEKNACKNELSRMLVEQGIIRPNDEIPSNYLAGEEISGG